MKTESYYEGINHVISIHSDEGKSCEHCSDFRIDLDTVAESVNHYIKDHGYKLLHVGQQTGSGSDGRPFQMTVAIVGR